MFGKPLSEYLSFQWVALALTAAVGLTRLGLSLAGYPNSQVVYVSITVPMFLATIYYGIAVYTKRFGSYKQLLPLSFFQAGVTHLMAITGILFTIAGFPNIYAAPEFSPPNQSQWIHLLAHATVGMVVVTLLLWGVSSLVLLVSRKLIREPAAA